MKHFGFSIFFTIICLIVASWWGYHTGGINALINTFLIVAILGIMEVSLSFDNAVINASVLKHWNDFWRKLFLTVGIFIAVFGMRLLFPLLIVAHTADMGMVDVWNLALKNPNEYSSHLTAYHAEISTFGGMFLLLVFLNFMFDKSKNIHWLKFIEKYVAKLANAEYISILISLILLLTINSFIDESRRYSVLVFGLQGIIIYLGVKGLSSFLESNNSMAGEVIKKGSIGGFLYLEILDASFSFDGVIGSFAITKDIVIIMLGLGIGAIFVRSITIYLVDKGTLDNYIYLEHGAHYAIGALAIIMLLSIKFHIPEVVTGLIGVFFIVLSIISSIRYKRS